MIRKWNCYVDTSPVAKQRPRMTKTGIAYTPQKTKMAEKLIRTILTSKKPPFFEGPVCLDLVFFLIRPKSTKRKYPCVRPDIDNYIKLVMDACNGLLFKDDAQVCQLIATKTYGKGERTGIEINISELNGTNNNPADGESINPDSLAA